MGIFKNLRARLRRENVVSRMEMVTEYGEGFYAWDGKLYQSDMVRAAIRPKTHAVGKIVGKHLFTDSSGKLHINPRPYIRFLLEEPNPYMTGQMLQEKLANQLALNGNAFALIIRDENGLPCEIYPIPTSAAEAVYIDAVLYIRFYYRNGKSNLFPYTDLIHLRGDYCNGDIFGESQVAALASLMECAGALDKGLLKAIKNSGLVRWLLQYKSATRPEDIKAQTKQFVDTYLSTESDVVGAAGVNSNVEAKQVEPKDVMPNSASMKELRNRVYAFFNTNEKIVTSAYTDEEWNAYYESEIEPLVLQFTNAWTQRLFTRRERAAGNRIAFEASNLQCASIQTKLALVSMVDRGALTPNEWRATMNLSPVEGGDKPVRRLDTEVVKSKDST